MATSPFRRRRLELLLAFPAFVAESGGTRPAAARLEVDERRVRKWLTLAREAATTGTPGAEGNVLISSWRVRGLEVAGVAAVLARWLDARRGGGR